MLKCDYCDKMSMELIRLSKDDDDYNLVCVNCYEIEKGKVPCNV